MCRNKNVGYFLVYLITVTIINSVSGLGIERVHPQGQRATDASDGILGHSGWAAFGIDAGFGCIDTCERRVPFAASNGGLAQQPFTDAVSAHSREEQRLRWGD